MPVLAGRLCGQALENLDEVVIAHEADPVADLIDRQVGAGQEPDRLIYPYTVQIVDEGAAGFLLNRVLT